MTQLVFHPRTGLAGDMFIGALLSLHESLGKSIDLARLRTYLDSQGVFLVTDTIHETREGRINGKQVTTSFSEPVLTYHEARNLVSQGCEYLRLSRSAMFFAKRALELLITAETVVHQSLDPQHASSGDTTSPSIKYSSEPTMNHSQLELVWDIDSERLRVIGHAFTPYKKKTHAPYQSTHALQSEGVYIELSPQYAEGLKDLDSFTDIWVLSFLHLSPKDYPLIVIPPWDPTQTPRGVFATRSPHRPTPIGLTRTRLLKIERNRLYLDRLDLLTGTPILDIKPVIGSGEQINANDGWIHSNDHMELHRKGIPHVHGSQDGHLHEAADIVFDILGVAVLLDNLGFPDVSYVYPVYVGGGKITFSHGTLPVPAPATSYILKHNHIAWDYGPFPTELTTPTGVAILSALNATPMSPSIYKTTCKNRFHNGFGFGTKQLPRDYGNYLKVTYCEK